MRTPSKDVAAGIAHPTDKALLAANYKKIVAFDESKMHRRHLGNVLEAMHVFEHLGKHPYVI